MDPVRFDRIAKSLSSPETRRRVFGVLAAVPVVGGLLGILSPEETEAAGRRKRRKTRHKRRSGDNNKNRKGKHKKKKPQCTLTTCVAQGKACGSLADGCGTTLDCGPCTCATGCATCQTCNPATDLYDPIPNDTPCDDGNLCTLNDVCTDGVCGGSPKCGGGQGCAAGVCCLLPSATGATEGLQEAIDGAQSGNTIRLCAGTWELTSTVNIAKNLTLIGAGTDETVLDGGNAVRVLQIAGGTTVTVQDLTITKGRANDGGGILNAGTLTLLGVAATGSTATDNGGGIYYAGGTVVLEDGSRVSGNTASLGGGIDTSGGTVTLQTGSRVTGNTAGTGGGIYHYFGARVTLDPGAIVCRNTTVNCDGNGNFSGTCPYPSDGSCPD